MPAPPQHEVGVPGNFFPRSGRPHQLLVTPRDTHVSQGAGECVFPDTGLFRAVFCDSEFERRVQCMPMCSPPAPC